MTDKNLDDVQRWTAKRRMALVLRILQGETFPQEATRKHGLKVSEVQESKDRFLSGAENSLRSRPRDENNHRDAEIRRLRQKVGEMTMDMDIIKEAMKQRSFGRTTSDE